MIRQDQSQSLCTTRLFFSHVTLDVPFLSHPSPCSSQARTNYEKAISQGHQAFLLEEDSSSRDIFSCNVGNLQPGSKASVTLKYVQELPLETDGALRFVLPAVLNPRYQFSGEYLSPLNTSGGWHKWGNFLKVESVLKSVGKENRTSSLFIGSSKDSCLNVKTPIVPVEDLPYTLSMVATIDSKHGIEKVQSNCPLSPTEYLGEDKTSAQVVNERILLLSVPLLLEFWLSPHPVLPKW